MTEEIETVTVQDLGHAINIAKFNQDVNGHRSYMSLCMTRISAMKLLRQLEAIVLK